MLVIEPEKRLSLNQIEAHKWMKQVTIKMYYIKCINIYSNYNRNSFLVS